jgi:hypothetical protein
VIAVFDFEALSSPFPLDELGGEEAELEDEDSAAPLLEDGVEEFEEVVSLLLESELEGVEGCSRSSAIPFSSGTTSFAGFSVSSFFADVPTTDAVS